MGVLVNYLPVCSDIFYLTTYLKVVVLSHSESMTAFNLCLCVCGTGMGWVMPLPLLKILLKSIVAFWASQVALVVKNLAANAGDLRHAGSIPGSGRSPGGRNGNPLQYSCLENPMDRGAWGATVHRVVQSQTRLKQLSTQHADIKHLLYTGLFGCQRK